MVLTLPLLMSSPLWPYRLVAFLYVLLGVVECRRGVKSAGAPDEHLSLVLGVQVDESPAGEESRLHPEGSVHAGLLRDREHTLDPTHRKVAVKKGEHRGDADAVVRSECRVLGYHPAVLDYIFDRILEEVVPHAASFLADHVLMSLENECRHILLAFARFLDNADIVCLVGFTLKMPLLRKTLKKGCHRLFVTGFPRDPGDLLENGENFF